MIPAPVIAQATRPVGRYAAVGLLAALGAAVANLAIVAVAHQFDVSFEVKGEAIPLLGFPQLTLIAAVIVLCERTAAGIPNIAV